MYENKEYGIFANVKSHPTIIDKLKIYLRKF